MPGTTRYFEAIQTIVDSARRSPVYSILVEVSVYMMTANEIVEALAALAHEHRLAAFRLLVEAGPNGLPAGMVAERLHMPPSSLSFHLQQLLRAQLITQRRLSRQIFYAANFAAMDGLIAYLTKNCCGQDEDSVCAAPVCAPGAPAKRGGATTRRKSA